ncbi:MAG: DMT family transporter [Mesorhizobium sp.]|nr:DMT family transporter [Mesorhizobium sp.]MBL8580107.1 DMT family transporter [Mesorhizobium sp.]
MTDDATQSSGRPHVSRREEQLGFLLVFLSALFWSFGGAIARFIETPDTWAVVFWRSFWATIFLVGFMLMRDGARGTLRLFRDMGVPGIAVGVCFAIASSCFVIAIAHTTVANVVLMQAGVPLIAALMAFIFFRERVSPATWVAIGAVICGVAIMVSESFDGTVSPVGDSLALLIAFAFSTATVITRRYSHVRMTPATCLGTLIACVFAFTQASALAVSGHDMAWLFAFGALNLGLGLAFFATGARLIPAAFAALLGTFETLLGPVWVWLVHGEVPSARTLIGGAVIFAALLVHIGLQFRRMAAPARPGVTGIPAPN